jgi:hypothetical protein
VTAVRFKVGEKPARDVLAALVPLAPWYARSGLQSLLEKIGPQGIEVSVARARKHHTTPQQGYYWLCVGIFAKAVGMSPDEAHSVVLCEATGSKETTIGERVYRTPVRRSSGMNVEEYANLIDTLHRVAAFCGCVLPDPEVVA